MFYSQSLLSRNGPLGNIWIAAYCLKKLKKHQIAGTDITSSIDKIIPEVELPYRLLAQLLLGVVRIFSKKVDYLYHDCNKALTNLRYPFIPTYHASQRRPNIGPQHNVQKKVNGEPQQTLKESNEGAYSLEQHVCALKNETLAMQIEAMCVPYHDVTISLPEHFELDAFDLNVRDGGDTAKPHEESMLEDVHRRDEWLNENDQHCFLNEHRQMEVDIRAEYNSACFTPVEDVIPHALMDLEIVEFHNLCNLEVSGTVEKSESLQGLRACSHPGAYLHDDQDHQVNSVNPQDKMPSDIQGKVQCDEPKDQVEPLNLCGSTPTHNKESHNPTDGNSEAYNQSGAPVDSGLPSPKFAARTPARKETRKETHQKFKKSRILFDETIVLSNGTMRVWINDASNLVCKRRKAPHTSLDAWKAYRMTHLQDIFMEPVIPYISCEHKAILHKCLPDRSPQKKSSSLSSADMINLQHEVSNKSIEPRDSLQGRTISDTPLVDIFSGISTPERSEVRMKELSPLGITTYALDMMDKDQAFSEKESYYQDGGWSVRTRVVAKYLYDRFLNLKEQKRVEILNLDEILEGQTRAESARFFYETLILKTHGCIDVEQDSPYGAIVASANPLLEVLVEKNPIK